MVEIMDKLNNDNNKKKSIGRQKIEIKKIEKDSARQVAFTKRRQGVMKKASELSILCGSEFAIIVFSPGGHPFCFGHPSFDYVVTRFLTCNRLRNTGAKQEVASHLNMQYSEMEERLEAAKEMRAVAEKRLVAAVEAIGAGVGRALEKDAIEVMSLEELESAKRVIEEAKLKVQRRQEEVAFEAAVQPALEVRPISVVAPAASTGGVTAGSFVLGEVKPFTVSGRVDESIDQCMMRYNCGGRL